jgi:hypothetical protein
VDPPELCEECGETKEWGIRSELDDSFVCDDCAIGYTHTYQDCD